MRRPSSRLNGIRSWNRLVRPTMNSSSNTAGGPARAVMRRASELELARRQLLHDLLAAAADHHHLDLAVDALALRAAHEAHRAEDLHRLVGAELHRPGRVVLEQAELGDAFAVERAGVVAVDHRFDPGMRAEDAHLHVDELVTDRLVLDERLAEGLPL